MSKRSGLATTDAERGEEAAAAQRVGSRRLSIEERFRQNDSISQFRAAALRSSRRAQ